MNSDPNDPSSLSYDSDGNPYIDVTTIPGYDRDMWEKFCALVDNDAHH